MRWPSDPYMPPQPVQSCLQGDHRMLPMVELVTDPLPHVQSVQPVQPAPARIEYRKGWERCTRCGLRALFKTDLLDGPNPNAMLSPKERNFIRRSA